MKNRKIRVENQKNPLNANLKQSNLSKNTYWVKLELEALLEKFARRKLKVFSWFFYFLGQNIKFSKKDSLSFNLRNQNMAWEMLFDVFKPTESFSVESHWPWTTKMAKIKNLPKIHEKLWPNLDFGRFSYSRAYKGDSNVFQKPKELL